MLSACEVEAFQRGSCWLINAAATSLALSLEVSKLAGKFSFLRDRNKKFFQKFPITLAAGRGRSTNVHEISQCEVLINLSP
jgi:hypothetical protein